MSEEKDVSELEAEARMGHDPGVLSPIPPQLMTTDGRIRAAQRPPGEWLRAHNVTPPPGSFIDETGRDWLQEWPRYISERTPVAGHGSGGGR
jgi:phospholipid/cholesterol/gamma-HCH transport system ATP-binding protein